MAVAALLLWLCTAAVGGYLLVTAVHASGSTELEPASGPAPTSQPAPPVHVPARQDTTADPAPRAAASAPAKPVRDRDRFDPPSLQRAKSEPGPGMKALAEFAHPALAMIGFGIWLGYVVTRNQVWAEIGLGVLLGVICAGLSWFIGNTRAVRRAAADPPPSTPSPGPAPLAPSPRLLTLHAIGATLTLLFTLLIAVRA